MKNVVTTMAAMALLATTGAVSAQDFEKEIIARKGQMQVMAINLGILGGMARGTTEYDAEAAQAAADSIVGISMVNQAPLRPAGSDSMSVDGTRALPALFEDTPELRGIWSDLGAAALELQAAASTGQEAIGPALGKIGGTCKACHDDYRAPE